MHTQSVETTQETTPDLSQATAANVERGFERLRAFTDRYNLSIGDTGETAAQLDAAQIESALRTAGAVNDETLVTLSAADICQHTGVNQVVGKALQQEFASLKSDTKKTPRRRITRFGAQALELEELVSRYNPTDIGSAVNIELKKRLKDVTGRQPKVIVFDDEGNVMTEVTTRLISEAMQGDQDLDQIEAGGKIRYTFKVGELPEQIIEIHPITRKQLRSNGMGRDGLNWAEVPLKGRQLLYLARKTEELEDGLSRRDLVYYHSIAKTEGGFAQLQQEFPEAAREFDEREKLGSLPALKRYRRGGSDKRKRSSDRLFYS